ncbi:carboxypeptidase regulatory-like domain-containing protein [Halosolutus amylolyticus]|uniref:Carboxypeptidase regulatory-like domain-containing protein n=1 Tax=Halosolutus amylolyticus TaxID=2932267 RepID=A0ABD5PM91_9EURY|nr:carboxypeptidase regulatory-like domain-containing protein [Halosolutus amylolyticus]
MSRRGEGIGLDERAVTIQIGAVLLLAIAFSALALYQVNAVPQQNERVEIDHNDRVRGDLVELRDSILNTGTTGGTQGVPIELGTQYESRVTAVNPPHPTGTVRTIEPESNVTIEEPDGSDHEFGTRQLVYEPDYNEYTSAPRTVVEHGFVYNRFDETNVSVGSQQLIGDERISIVLLDGTVNERSTGTASVSVESLDRVRTTTLEPDTRITLPTRSAERWEAQLEETAGVRYDESESGAGEVVLVLEKEFDLDIARVGVGSGGSSLNDDFDIGTERRESNASGDGGAYATEWNVTRIEAENANVDDCDSGCELTVQSRETTTVWIETDPVVDGATVEYAVDDTDLGTIDSDGVIENGEDDPTLDINESAVDARGGEAWLRAFVSSGSDGDRLSFKLVSDSPTGTIDGTVTDVDTGDGIQDATVTVEDTGNETTTDANGTYALTNVPSGEHTVVATADGYSSEWKDVTVPNNGSVDASFELSSDTGTIDGTVTDAETGEAIRGATVTVDDTGQSAQTDVSGEYAIDDVPAGEQDVTVAVDTHQDDMQTITVDENGNTTADFDLQPENGSISGVVRDGETTDGIAGTTVTAVSTDGEFQTMTADDGTYTIDVPADEYDVSADVDGYVESGSSAVSVGANEDVSGVDFALDAQNGSINGVVEDANGEAIADATVTAVADDGSEYEATTATDGGYAIEMPRDEYTVSADADGYLESDSRAVSVGPGEDVTGVDFGLDRPGVYDATATDLAANEAGQNQAVTFTLKGDLEEGETIEIDLDAAQNWHWLFGRDVDYQNSRVVDVSGSSGSEATFTQQDQFRASITYTAGETDSDGDVIEILIDDVQTGTDGSYPVDVLRQDIDNTNDDTTGFSVG